MNAPQPTGRFEYSQGSLRDRYECYRTFADDGKGGDITNPGQPLKTFEEWSRS